MKQIRAKSGRDRWQEHASLLIEVMIAVVLVCTLVVPLATGIQLATKRADGLRSRTETICAEGNLTDGSGGWTWGPMAESVAWQSGPVLRANVRQEDGADSLIGLWVDGWLLGEWGVESGGQTVVGPLEWSGMAGSELLLRVRDRGGGWGPPFRSVVPDEYGDVPGERASREWSPSSFEHWGKGLTVAHVPMLGTPSLRASWTDEPITESVLGLTCILPPATRGYCELELEGDVQSWYAEEGRAVDVYY